MLVLDRKTSELRPGKFNKSKGNRSKFMFYEEFFLIIAVAQVFLFER
jgi:hypothetical protein